MRFFLIGHLKNIKLLPLLSSILMVVFLTPASVIFARELQSGDVVFEANFDGDDAFKGWSGSVKPGPGFQSRQSLYVEQEADPSNTFNAVSMALPADQLRGCDLLVSGMVRAENISRKPKPYFGVKFMAPIVTDNGDKLWPNQQFGIATFDWTTVNFLVHVPYDVKQISLCLGLQEVTGKAWFDDIKVTVKKVRPEPKLLDTATPVYKGHSLARLRGTMSGPNSPNAKAEDLLVLGKEWNANLIRWPLILIDRQRPGDADFLDLAAYDQWLEGELKKLDTALPLCEKYGLMVVVDLHSPPGGNTKFKGSYIHSNGSFFSSVKCQQKFIETWEKIARRYKNSKIIWGYDLVNEPEEKGSLKTSLTDDTVSDWHELAERAARAIRAIDAERTIIVEAGPGSPTDFVGFEPIAASNVVYSVHFYEPITFTHQSIPMIPGASKEPCRYPGEIDGKMWNKEALELSLKPVIDFQKRYGGHIYIGEFSAIRWAPDHSAFRYLKDAIDLFEENGWDWSYHAFREWDGWSVEHDDVREHTTPATTQTEREKLLRKWFSKNQKL